MSGLGGDLRPHPRASSWHGVQGGQWAPSARRHCSLLPPEVGMKRTESPNRSQGAGGAEPSPGAQGSQSTQPPGPSVQALAVDPLFRSDAPHGHRGPGHAPFAVGASVCTLEAEPTTSVCPSGPRRENSPLPLAKASALWRAFGEQRPGTEGAPGGRQEAQAGLQPPASALGPGRGDPAVPAHPVSGPRLAQRDPRGGRVRTCGLANIQPGCAWSKQPQAEPGQQANHRRLRCLGQA